MLLKVIKAKIANKQAKCYRCGNLAVIGQVQKAFK